MDILTIRLAEALGPLEQFWFVALDVSELEADPVVRTFPEVAPLDADHSTEYGTVPVPLVKVKALPVPLPVAVIEYALVAVLLQTQMLWALEAGEAGSCPVKSTSERPDIFARLGTDAVMLIVPVEVEPSDPSVAADADTKGTATPSANTAAASAFLPKQRLVDLVLSVMCTVRVVRCVR